MEKIEEKIYAGFLGMNIGIRLGAPVEAVCWDYKRIKNVYGTITDYLRPYKMFAADDDVNGPVFFARALNDCEDPKNITAEDVGEAWLNYARECKGMFWWGGYGNSTEHTAYLNLKNGILAPISGSAALNGRITSEQIGGQIFIDTWGLLCPGDPARAAKLARSAASVSHDGEALNGAAFIAAMIAEAFKTSNVDELFAAGLQQIPADSKYATIINSVISFHKQHPEDFMLCRDYLEKNHPYELYGGACPIVSNAGVIALALCYGGGKFSRSIEIAVMCGWDTDCNAGNIGTVLGVATGLEGIPEHYRAPLHDTIILSGISGYLNILDIPSYVKMLANGVKVLKGEMSRTELLQSAGNLVFDFSLPGSTHGFRTENENRISIKNGGDCLNVQYRAVGNGNTAKVYYKPFYRRADFDDERYQPVFSPQIGCGRIITFDLHLDLINGQGLQIIPYVHKTLSGELVACSGSRLMHDGDDAQIRFEVPDLKGDVADEVGLMLDGYFPDDDQNEGILRIDRFAAEGPATYTVHPDQSICEFGNMIPFSTDGGSFTREDARLQCRTLNTAQAMTGNYYCADSHIQARVYPCFGGGEMVGGRVKGALYGIYGGFDEIGKARIIEIWRGHKQVLAECGFSWKEGSSYLLELTLKGTQAELTVNHALVLTAECAHCDYGMCALAKFQKGRAQWEDVDIEELRLIGE